jgi:hypothetical protein
MRYLWTLLLMISMGLLSWGAAQGTRADLFDLKKSEQELEVMKGILTTTLNFFLKESRKASTQKPGRDEDQVYTISSWGGSRVSAFYLYGQGATFIIPVSSWRYAKAKPVKVGALDADQLKLNAEFDALQALQLEEQIATEQQFEAELAQLELNRVVEAQEQELAKLQTELTFGLLAGVPGGVHGGIVGGVPGGVAGGIPGGVRGPAKARPKPSKPVAQAAPQPPQPPQPAAEPRGPQREEEVRKKLEDLQRNVVKRREMEEVKRKELLERLAQIKVYLIEALANHGDSLTHVKPNEYINLVLTAEDGDSKWFKLADSEDGSPHREIMSVQKSVITDYKAGRLTLDAFKQKVLQYNN